MAKTWRAASLGLFLSTSLVSLGQVTGNSSQTSVPVAPAYSDNTPLTSAAALSSDNRPPSGAQPVGLGFTQQKLLKVSVNASQSWDSNPPVTSQQHPSSWQPEPAFGGNLQLLSATGKYQSLVNYTGNVLAYPNESPAVTTYQSLQVSQNIVLGRWMVTGADTFKYSPNSPFGGYGYGLLPAGSGAANGAVISPQYSPNQSILTPYTSSYFNTVLGQVAYSLSRKSSWTASGSYGILRSPDDGFYDTNQSVASAGYNHGISSRSTIFANYVYSRFQYTNIDSSFTTQTVQLGYSRQVVGRISLQASGGPAFTNENNLGAKQLQVRFSGAASLMYSRGTTSLAITYLGGTTSGSGVLTGAQTQSVQSTIGHSFSRFWTSSISVGYSHNSGLSQSQQETYNSLYLTPSLRRAITSNLGVSVNYSYQQQLTNSGCAGLACGSLARNLVTAGIDYRFRPYRLE